MPYLENLTQQNRDVPFVFNGTNVNHVNIKGRKTPPRMSATITVQANFSSRNGQIATSLLIRGKDRDTLADRLFKAYENSHRQEFGEGDPINNAAGNGRGNLRKLVVSRPVELTPDNEAKEQQDAFDWHFSRLQFMYDFVMNELRG